VTLVGADDPSWIGGSPMSCSILVVDDSTAYRKALKAFFESKCSWTVCGEAADGREAVEKAERLHPDLIVLDFSMPVLNGLEVAARLKHIRPTVPILMLTAFGDRFLAEMAYKAGVGAVIAKGDPQTLENCARLLLRHAFPVAK
jgi:DNA-binding NarL/FixJ family response regulator